MTISMISLPVDTNKQLNTQGSKNLLNTNSVYEIIYYALAL